MNIAEMRARERYDEIFPPSVAACLSRHADRSINVVDWDQSDAQRWWLQPTLGGYFVDEPNHAVRTYLRDSLRYTPFRSRALPQWALVSGLSSTTGLRMTRRPGVAVAPTLPAAQACLVVPGNQRIRLFDFDAKISTVTLKCGFSPVSMQRELAARRALDGAGLTVPLVASDPAGLWFQEPIVDAYALPRCPPWFDRSRLQSTALADLEAWSRRSETTAVAPHYVDDLITRCEVLVAELRQRFTDSRIDLVPGFAQCLGGHARTLDLVALWPTHGDFQPGNILVGKYDRRITIIDWEHASVRSRWYDRTVIGLALRRRRGLAARTRAALGGKVPRDLVPLMAHSAQYQCGHLSLVLLEDLVWTLSESTTGTYRCLPDGLDVLLDEYRLLPIAC